MTPHRPRAFTLIEILVVVSIIAILIALLIPALDKAMYAAKFASCGAHQKGIGTGISEYAMDNKRFYPKRTAYQHLGWTATVQTPVVNASFIGFSWAAMQGALRFSVGTAATVNANNGSTSTGTPAGDDRPTYAKYMALDLFEDPFCERTGLTDPGTYEPGQVVIASMDLYWDFGYEFEQKQSKLGSRFTWTHPMTGKKHAWNILAGDRDAWRGGADAVDGGVAGYAFSSHPDYKNRLENKVRRGEEGDPAFQAYEWVSLWQNADAWPIARYNDSNFDRNYVFADGSVQQFRKINSDVDTTTNTPKDNRLAIAPIWWFQDDADYYYDEEYHLLPKDMN